MPAHGQVDYAMTALRERASEFLLKPLEPALLLATVERVLVEAATRPRGQVVLAIGAHADDVEIGCGGTLARHIEHGDTVVVLALSAGRADAAVAEATLAAEVLGARLRLGHLRPTEITDGRVTIAAIEHAIEELSPSVVYTHSEHDDDPDHRNTNRATLIAARQVDEVLAYETSTTTVGFQPNRFVDISGHLGTKLTAVDSYVAHRAGDVVTATARYWSRSGAGQHVEALQVLRSSSF
jgi:LmbE family N-acetylglucosaminyl deacetylase